MRPETALDSWRQWSAGLNARPVIIGALDDGRSNRSYLLDSDGHKMVLRINTIDDTMTPARRFNEIAVWRAVSEQGIAPALYFADSEAAYLVSAYIETKLPPRPQLDEYLVQQAITLLDRFHKADAFAPPIDYTTHIEHYWRLIGSGTRLGNLALRDQREPMQKVLETIQASATATGLCHHDPVIANFVGSKARLYLIDFEYAATGLAVLDYAALGIEWGIDTCDMASKTGFDAELLALAESLYRYLCALWEEVNT